MEETAALAGSIRFDFSGAKLQTVQNLLSGQFHQTKHVPPRVNIFQIFDRNIAVQRGTNAAAVHKGYINIITPAVKIIIRRVGAEIADCRLLFANQTLVAVVGIKPHVRMGDHAFIFRRHLRDNFILNRFHVRIGRHVRQILSVMQLGGHIAVGVNRHFADIFQIAFCLR